MGLIFGIKIPEKMKLSIALRWNRWWHSATKMVKPKNIWSKEK